MGSKSCKIGFFPFLIIFYSFLMPMSAFADSWQEDITWAFDNNTGPDQVDCANLYVQNDIGCLTNGGRACLLRNARWLAQNGNCGKAVDYAVIAQCHNQDAMERIRAASVDDVCHFIATFSQ